MPLRRSSLNLFNPELQCLDHQEEPPLDPAEDRNQLPYKSGKEGKGMHALIPPLSINWGPNDHKLAALLFLLDQ